MVLLNAAENRESTELECNSFRTQERVIALGKAHMSQDISNIIDYSDVRSVDSEFLEFPDNFDINNFIVMASPLGDEWGSQTMERTKSDGRSVGKFVGLIKDVDGHQYCEIQIKGIGGGTQIPGRAFQYPHYEESDLVTSETALKGKKLHSGKHLPLRYVTRKLREISGHFGFSRLTSAALDSAISNELQLQGLRTRRLIYANEFGEDVIFSTPDETKTFAQVKQELGYSPALEIWALRSRYRLRDIANYPIFENNNHIFRSTRKETVNFDDFWDPLDKPYHIRLRENLGFNTVTLEEVHRDFQFLAQEILLRAELDEDERFQHFAEAFNGINLEDLSNHREFWSRYLDVFGEILGEQVATMYSVGAFSNNRQLNDQNITLMAEIVDHDVTSIEEELKSDSLRVIDQLSLSLHPFRDLIARLFSVDLIDENINPEDLLNSYLHGLISKLNIDDLNLLKSILDTELKKAPTIEDFQYYQDRAKTLKHGLSEEFNMKVRGRMSAMKKHIDYTLLPLIPTNEKRKDSYAFALKKDLLGSMALRYIVNSIVNTTT